MPSRVRAVVRAASVPAVVFLPRGVVCRRMRLGLVRLPAGGRLALGVPVGRFPGRNGAVIRDHARAARDCGRPPAPAPGVRPPGLPAALRVALPAVAARRRPPGIRRDNADRTRPPDRLPAGTLPAVRGRAAGPRPRVPPAHDGRAARSRAPSPPGRPPAAPARDPPRRLPAGDRPSARFIARPSGERANRPLGMRRITAPARATPGSLRAAAWARPERRSTTVPAVPAATTPAAIHHSVGEPTSTRAAAPAAATGRPSSSNALRGSTPACWNFGGVGVLACGFTFVSPAVSPGEAGREGRAVGAGGVGRGVLGGFEPSGGQVIRPRPPRS